MPSFAPGPEPGQSSSTTEHRTPLEEHHLVATERGRPGSLQAGHPSPDHHDARRLLGRNDVGQPRMPNRRIDRAVHRHARVQAADAPIVEPDARPVPPAIRDLQRQIRVGDDRPGHPDELDPGGDHRLGHGRLDVPPRDQRRHADLAPEPDRPLVVDALGQRVAGDEVAGRQARRAGAAADAEEVDRAGRRQAPRDLDHLVRTQAAGQALIDRHPEADDEPVGHRGPHGKQHLAARTGSGSRVSRRTRRSAC